MVSEVVDYYRRNGSSPIVVTLDCSRAFDTCQYSKLFKALGETLPLVVVRMMYYCYTQQRAWVRWGGECSNTFGISNGVGQGKVCSPTFWGLYMLPLLTELRRKDLGCHVAGLYMGSAAFADDLILVCPVRSAAMGMLKTCEEWAEQYGITFLTDPNPAKSKTKAMVVKGERKGSTMLAPLSLCGNLLPYVPRLDHLGHVLHESGKF